MRIFSVIGLSTAAILGTVVAAGAQERMPMDEPAAGYETLPNGYYYGLPGPMGWGIGPMGYGQGMYGQGPGAGMMGFGMMGFGMMGPGMMGPGMMQLFLILLDTDGDGALSLEEYQQLHARIFGYLDADGDGRLTLEELDAHWQDQMDGS